MKALRKHLIVFLCVSAVAIAGCSNKSAAPQMPVVVTGLAVGLAHTKKMPSTIHAIGTVQAAESELLSSQVTGRVTSVAVHEGDSVMKGQTLVVLDGAGTGAGYTRIRAPFAGLVTARQVDPGTLARPGTPLLELEKAGALQLYTSVDESLLAFLQKGMVVAVEISALSSRLLHGRVAEIVPTADPASRRFPVKIDLPATAGLRSGMFGKARIGSGRHPALVIPQTALVTHGSLNGVWVLDEYHTASLRYVKLGVKNDAEVEVLWGLSNGEMVVLSPGDRELAGKQVEVRQ